MAWSIFRQPNGDQMAVAWAVLLLQALGLQATPDRLQFIYDWERSEGGGGAYNPLNQGPVPGQPQLTTTGQQYGGGAADFAGWSAGIQGAVAYLNMPNYGAVAAALNNGSYQQMSQALWNSPWAAGHYGYGRNWATTQYPAMSPAQISQVIQQNGMSGPGSTTQPGQPGNPNPTGPQPNAAAQPGNSQTAGLPPPPPLNNMPALIAYINQYFPDDAWMLNTPGAAQVIEGIVSAGITDPAQIQSRIQSSQWWKTTSAAVRAYQKLIATDPAALNFAVPGSQAQQTLMMVLGEAGKLGVNLTNAQAESIATNYMKYGWQGTTEIDQNIGGLIWNTGAATNAPGLSQQLKAQAGQYLLPMSPDVLQSWSQNIAAGTQNMQQFQAYLAQTASTKWTGMASQIQQGYTPAQITDNLRQQAAKTMEVSPDAVDFVNNPMYSKILDFVPPAAPGHPAQAPAHRLMTQSEMDAYLKGTDNWQYTQQARDQVSALAKSLAETWGKMG